MFFNKRNHFTSASSSESLDDCAFPSSHSASFVLIDDEGNAVTPHSERSCLSAEQTFAGDFTRMQQLLPKLEAIVREAQTVEDAVASLDSMLPLDAPALADDAEDSNEDDEWILERIIRRHAKVEGDWQYLCKWKFYEDPTWETRTLLMDEGYGKHVRAFDLAKQGVFKSTEQGDSISSREACGANKPRRMPTGVEMEHDGDASAVVARMCRIYKGISTSMLREMPRAVKLQTKEIQQYTRLKRASKTK